MSTSRYPKISLIKPHILIADDDDAMRIVLRDILITEGISGVTLAADGQEAIDILASESGQQFQVALLDVKMPNVDGFSVLRYIKAHRPEIKVIMITAYNELKLAMEAKELGASNFVAKPIMRKDLLETIETTLAS